MNEAGIWLMIILGSLINVEKIENLNFMNKIRMDLELLEQFLFHCGNDIMSLLEKENSVRFI